MNRRNFFKKSAVAGVALPTLVLNACTSDPAPKTMQTEEPAAPKSADDFVLNEITIGELQQKMKDGSYSAESLTLMYMQRIEAIDKKGPQLNTVIELNPDALDIARALDQERKSGKIRGPLHGIPVLIKDNIDTGDKMMTTAGSLALDGHIAAKDAFIVKQLRDAGAVLLGKTNLSEWANFRSTRSTSGWSSRGGQTKNPYLLERSPCGSSSGSGAAVSANLCVVAIGTETNGSIACPSSVNGIVGIKPTVGLLSRSGIIPISKTQDTAGPMARTVTDAAILLRALTGVDEQDPVTNTSKGQVPDDYTRFLDPNGLSGKRIGIEKAFLKGHESVDALLQKAIELMKSKGATVVEVDLIKQLKSEDEDGYTVMLYEFKDGLNKYLSTANAGVKSLTDVIKFNKDNEAKAMPFFKQEILEASENKGDLHSKEYLDALRRLLSKTRGAIDKLLKTNQLDAIAGPANGPSWCIDLINGDFFTGYGAYSPAAVAGYPSITVPMGLVNELPIGLAFFGKAFSEGELIRIAYAFEQGEKGRVMPGFKRTVN